MQQELFSAPRAAAYDHEDIFGLDDDLDHLRWYQREALAAIDAGWAEFRSQLVVMATGLGKTELFATAARNASGPVLVLAHRDELVEQAAKRLELICGGEYVEIEKADMTASSRARLVVGSVQSFTQKRLERMGKERFSLVIADEAHHYVSPAFRRPLEFFDAPLLGVTATPDRADELALGQIFENVAYVMDIGDGIESGYLVPLKGRMVHLSEIDLSNVDTRAGDLAEGQLDKAMQKAVHGIVEETLRLEPGRQGIAFMPGVQGAEYLCNAFNARIPNSAAFVCGSTPPLERKHIVREFRERRIQYLCNCAVATEGFDAPSCDMIIQGRPTKSRALYAQICGRGTRVLPGVVDSITAKAAAGARRSLVRRSAKPDCMILDFVGNSGRHTLMTPEDLLGGDYSPAEIAEAKKQAEAKPGSDVREHLRAAREALKALARSTKASVKSMVVDFNPFSVFRLDRSEDDNRHAARWGARPATGPQLEALRRAKVPEADLKGLSSRDASKLLQTMAERRSKGQCTYAQLRRLQEYGITDTEVDFDRASAAITYISGKGWKKDLIDAKTLNDIIYAHRESGD